MISLYKDFLLPTGLLAGAIIGAGVFALPYVFMTAGLVTGFAYLGLAAVIYSLIHLMYADVILRTPDRHRFPGYIKEYLGEGAFALSIFMAVVEMLLVLTIYLILSVSFTALLGGDTESIFNLVLFWLVGSCGILFSARSLAAANFWVTGGIAAIIFTIFGLGAPQLGQIDWFDFTFNFNELLLPLSPILFALSGRVAISALVDYVRERPESAAILRRAIWAGTLLPAFFYALFIVGVIALSPSVSEDAVSGLRGAVGESFMGIFGILGFLSLISSYAVVGFDVRKILRDDLNFPSGAAVAVTIATPLLLYFLGVQQFLRSVSFVGGVFLALEGIFVVWMWRRADKQLTTSSSLLPRGSVFAAPFMIAVFLLALGNEIFKILS